jgi:glycine cleavage system H protein
MKEIKDLFLPGDVLYADDHEWARMEDGIVTIGVSDYAQDQLGDIVFVELPDIDDVYEKGEEFGSIESVKAVSEMYMPVGGKVVEVNSDLENSPELINQSPYDDGWIIKVLPNDEDELDELLEKDAYIAMLKGSE